MNKAILVGRLTKDPEIKTTASGIPVCSFTLAVDRRFVKAGEERKADFINCVAFRSTAEFICRFFTKGRMLGVVGSIQTRSWDGNDGQKHYATEVIVDEAYFTESKGLSTPAAGQSMPNAFAPTAPKPQDEPLPMSDDDFFSIESEDDLPF